MLATLIAGHTFTAITADKAYSANIGDLVSASILALFVIYWITKQVC